VSSDITCNQLRAGTQLNVKPLRVQLDSMNPQQASYYGGAAPYFRYAAYILSPMFDIRQQDLLVDTVNSDPKTQTNKQYRIINDPEWFPDGHYELVVDRSDGK
jgi:hypothetical protein